MELDRIVGFRTK